jgi:hypothetical protein
MSIELFHVSSVAPSLKGHRNVAIGWFVDKRQQPLDLPYTSLIENYGGAASRYQEGALEELFTKAEAEALANYLREHYDDNSVLIERAALPLPSNIIGLGACPAGGGPDFLLISENDDYRLPFEVWGYFDTRHAEPEELSELAF